MSVSCDDDAYADVWDERVLEARKEHKCDACGETISKGDRYARDAALYEGKWDVTKRCMRCEKILEHLREKCSEYNSSLFVDAPRVPMQDLSCGLDYEEEWGPCPDEIAALAFALPGEVT